MDAATEYAKIPEGGGMMCMEPVASNGGLGDVCLFRAWQDYKLEPQATPFAEGYLAVEFYSGVNVVTMGLHLAKVPTAIPWDILASDDMDIIRNAFVVRDLAKSGRVRYGALASPCSSLTLARHPPLRTFKSPLGCEGLSPKQFLLLFQGNILAVVTSLIACDLYDAGSFFSVENPARSFLWILFFFLWLYRRAGVIFSGFTMKNFGAMYLKWTFMLHNIPTFHVLSDVDMAPNISTCPIKLRGFMMFEKQWKPLTALACGYPPALGMWMGTLVEQAFAIHRQDVEHGRPITMADSCHDMGNPMLTNTTFYQQEDFITTQLLQLHSNEYLAEIEGAKNDEDELVEQNALVLEGGGAPMGLTPEEHVAWALTVPHPLQVPPELTNDEEFMNALRFEAKADDADAVREDILETHEAIAEEMDTERIRWLFNKVHPAHRLLLRNWHGPFVEWLVENGTFKDKLLPRDMTVGFMLAGEMPWSHEGMTPANPEKEQAPFSVEEVRQFRSHINHTVLSKLKESGDGEVVHDAVMEDVAHGAMGEPFLLKSEHLDEISLTRRIPVWTEKDSGELKCRVVDHYTESMMKACTKTPEKPATQGLEWLQFMVLFIMRSGHWAAMSKRDIQRAFRNLPMHRSFQDLLFVAYSRGGEIWAAEHLAAPFGAIGAVFAWHRLGEFIRWLVVHKTLAPIARYVDDYFGANRCSRRLSSCHVLDRWTKMIGIRVDTSKSVSMVLDMICLGAQVKIDNIGLQIHFQLAEVKARKWLQQLIQMDEDNICAPALASKFAGRFQFSVSRTFSRLGRAWIRPYYAQQYSPSVGNHVTPWMKMANRWWTQVLQIRPESTRCAWPSQERHTRIWVDAASSTGCVAAVCDDGQTVRWCAMVVPAEVRELWLEGGDNKIGALEMISIVLAQSTFAEAWNNSFVTLFCDNNGVVFSCAKASSRSKEINQMVGQVWLTAIQFQQALVVWRVETDANIADAPSRLDTTFLSSIGATEVAPTLPGWVNHLWSIPLFSV